MECINHPGVTAAGTCNICGKALCPDCLNRFNPPLCEPCLTTHNMSVARRLYFDIGVTAVIFLGVFAVTVTKNPGYWQAGVLFGLMLSCAYWGWQFMGRVSIPIAFTSGAALFAYLIAKALVALLLGFIVMPWQIAKRIKEITAIKRLKKQLEQGKV